MGSQRLGRRLRSVHSTLARIETNVTPLSELNSNMTSIAASAQGMAEKTKALNTSIGNVGASVAESNRRLTSVDGKLTQTATSLGALAGSIDGSLRSTRTVVRQFALINTAIGGMDTGLQKTITLMSASTPLTRAFATNTTRIAIAGGNGHKYGVPNVVPNSRVMGVVLPMITTMQVGGPLAARKNSADSSNFLVRTLLNRQVPDGTNVNAIIQPFDGFYGLPRPDAFVSTPVNGF